MIYASSLSLVAKEYTFPSPGSLSLLKYVVQRPFDRFVRPVGPATCVRLPHATLFMYISSLEV
jgi:hypothetical protein